MRGFGMTFDVATGFRYWYIGGDGAKRWADNDEIVGGLAGQQESPTSPSTSAPPATPHDAP